MLSGNYSLTIPCNIFKIIGENSSDYSGYAVSSISDLDGDKKPEILIGALGSGNWQSTTYVVSGIKAKTAGANLSLSTFAVPGSGVFKIVGDIIDDGGVAISTIGDLDEDGKPEILISEPAASDTSPRQGAIYIVSGAKVNLVEGGSLSLSSFDRAGSGVFKIMGEDIGARAGYAITAIDDLNQDGKPEILISAIFANQGAVYVVSGAKVNLAEGGSLSLSTFSIVDGGVFKIIGENNNDYAGYAISAMGDINGDNKPEILIGAFTSGDGKGAAYVVSGNRVNFAEGGNFSLSTYATTGGGVFKIIGANGDYLGNAISTIGDLNGDSKPELLIGAFVSDSGRGATYIVSGAKINLVEGGSLPLDIFSTVDDGVFKIIGEGHNLSGYAVSSIGDLDEDGKPEVLTGTYGFDESQGAVYVISGAKINLNQGGNLLLSTFSETGSGVFKITQENSNDNLGAAVSSIGDLDEDGKPEILMGAWRAPGTTYIFFSELSCPLPSPSAVSASIHQTPFLSSIKSTHASLKTSFTPKVTRSSSSKPTRLPSESNNSTSTDVSSGTLALLISAPIGGFLLLILIFGLFMYKRYRNKYYSEEAQDKDIPMLPITRKDNNLDILNPEPVGELSNEKEDIIVHDLNLSDSQEQTTSSNFTSHQQFFKTDIDKQVAAAQANKNWRCAIS